VSTMRFLMSPARLKKAFSTLMFDLAETSMKGMPSSLARAWPCSVETARFSSQSHLLPIRILLTPSVACCSTLENHVRMSVASHVSICQFVWSVQHVRSSEMIEWDILLKLLSSVTSYTNRIPIAPL